MRKVLCVCLLILCVPVYGVTHYNLLVEIRGQGIVLSRSGVTFFSLAMLVLGTEPMQSGLTAIDFSHLLLGIALLLA